MYLKKMNYVLIYPCLANEFNIGKQLFWSPILQILDLIEEVINWKVDIVFGPVADWFMPGIIELCLKRGKIKEIEKCKQFENVDTSLVS